MINKDRPREKAPFTKKIKRLFAPKKGINAHKLYPMEYYKPFWFNKEDFDGLDFVARCERVSKKEAAHLLNQRAFKQWMAEKYNV